MAMAAVDPAAFSAGVTRHPNQTLWAVIDGMLLVLILMLGADIFVQLGPVQSGLWLVCYGLILLRIGVVWPAFWAVLSRNRVVIIYPAICMASVLWSIEKSYSLVTAIQLSMTVLMGIYLGWRYSMSLILKVLAVVLSIGVGLSILHWATGIFPWPVYTRVGGLAGLFSSKNMLGLRALFAVISILAIMMMSRDQASPGFKNLAIIALVGNLFALGLSLSITSVLLLPVTVAVLLMLCWDRVPSTILVPGLLVSITVFCVGPVALVIAGINPIETVLGAVGKSSSLTGRVDLWDIAWHVHQEHPILGVGYRAFWQSAQFANERLATQEAGALTSRSFHNFALEILVSAGWAGVMAIFMLIWTAAKRMLSLFRLTRSAAMAGGLSLLLGSVISSLLGTSLYRGHEVLIILVVIFVVSTGEELRLLARRRSAGPEPMEG